MASLDPVRVCGAAAATDGRASKFLFSLYGRPPRRVGCEPRVGGKCGPPPVLGEERGGWVWVAAGRSLVTGSSLTVFKLKLKNQFISFNEP